MIGDISKKKNLTKINRYFDYVVNLGGYVDHISKIKTFQTHFIGCKNLVNIFEKKLNHFYISAVLWNTRITLYPIMKNKNVIPRQTMAMQKIYQQSS